MSLTTSTAYNIKKYKDNLNIHIKNVMNYGFKDINLCVEALTHSSLKNEPEHINETDNEKLEFIGDAVLDLIVSNFLLSKIKYSHTEGELTVNRAKIVKEKSLYEFAKYISLDKYIRVSTSAYKMKIHKNEGVLSDAFEALVGAIFLDSNFETVHEIILEVFSQKFLDTLIGEQYNYKGILNEHVSKNKLEYPRYEIIEITGPDHQRIYTSQISIEGKILATGKGNSIKKSEQEAARIAIEVLGVICDEQN